jgi:hypothetical protein
VLDDDHGQIMTLTTSMIMERRASAAAAAS